MVARRRALACLVAAAAALVSHGAAPAAAASFLIDPARSQLALSDVVFVPDANPLFVTDFVPAPGSDFSRSIDGTIEADATTGALSLVSLLFLGDPIQADQLRLGRDIGDYQLMALGLDFGTSGVATTTSGLAEYDVSTGSSRIRSLSPIDIAGAPILFVNAAAAPTLVDLGAVLELTVPVTVLITGLPVISEGDVSFTLSGQLVATAVPEPSTGLMTGFGLLLIGLRRRTGRWRQALRSPRAAHRLRLTLLLATIAPLALGLGECLGQEADDDDDILPPVDARDDSASTQQGVPVTIAVLANDLQDDGFVTATSEPGDVSFMIQGTIRGNFGFPEKLIYTPPAGFVGRVTFDYTIVGIGLEYDWESQDTATVTVDVTAGPPPVDAVDDMASTDVDQPVVVDVLANDSQDSDMVLSFTDAMDAAGVQPGSVALVTNSVEQLEYTPPTGFEGTASFEYTIEGAGVSFESGSMDTATVSVQVGSPGDAQVQFEEATSSLAFIEVLVFFLGQQAIDKQEQTAVLRQLGEASACVDFPSGVNVPVQALVLENGVFVVNGVCPQLVGGNGYTISLVDGASGLELVCTPGIADAAACAGP